MERLDIHVESLIFSADTPISVDTIYKSLVRNFGDSIDKSDIEDALVRLKNKYIHESYSFGVEEINEGFIFMTKPLYHDTVASLLKEKSNKRLSKVALETLSIIAYKQPISRTMIESIRGVNCDYTIQKLLEKELIEISGRDDGPGRPLLYSTSEKFMDYFGLRSIKDLPTLKEFTPKEDQIGEPSDIEIVSNSKDEEE